MSNTAVLGKPSLDVPMDMVQALLDSLPGPVFVKDTRCRFLAGNLAHARMMGARTPDALAGKTDFDFLPRDLATLKYAEEQSVINTGESRTCQQPAMRAAPDAPPLQFVKSPIRDKSGAIVGIMGMSREVPPPTQTEVFRASSEHTQAYGLLEALMDNIPDWIYFKDTEARFLKCSKTHAKRLGIAREQVVGKTDFDFHPAETAKEFFQDEKRIFQTGESLINKVEKKVKPGGEIMWTSTTKVPMRDKEGNIIGLVGVNRDITDRIKAEEALKQAHIELEQRVAERTRELMMENAERKRAEDALRESQAMYHALVQQLSVGVFRKDRDGRYVFVNSKFCHIQQMRAEDFLGKTPAEVAATGRAKMVVKTGADRFEQGTNHHEQIMQSGKPIDIEEEFMLPDGKRQFLHVVKSPVFGQDGEIVGTQGILLDVTERKAADEALAHERRLLRTLVDNLPDGIYAKDAECRKILANPADLRNLRCKTEADAIGKSDYDLFPPDVAAKFYADDKAVIQGQPVLNREEYFFDEDGKKHWLQTTKLPLRNEEGVVVGLVGIGRDITAIKEAEVKLDALHRELLLASRQAGMAEVATGVLHNVGNVLNSVNVSCSLVSDKIRKSKVSSLAKAVAMIHEHEADLAQFISNDPKGKQLPSYLETLSAHLTAEQTALLEELKSLGANIEHIKEIVSAQQGYAGRSGIMETVVISDVVEDALRIQTAAFARHGVTVIREFAQLPPFSLDKHKVLQILINILQNAKHACEADEKPDKRVIVRVKAAGVGRAMIEVEDTGVGIAAENLTRIFSHGFTTRKKGHGFGLHSGALAAKEMGGSLTAFSDGPGKGARFVLELPMKHQSEPAVTES